MAQEFVSELEKIMPAIELNFPSSPAFGPYRKIMPPESVQHPAKFNVYLVEFLIKNFTREGEIVLDCMAGCYDEETEVLTRAGWKRFSEITFSDEIATLNPATWCLEYQKPLGIIKAHYKGKMYKVRTKEIDLLVTPNHNMFVAFRSSLKPKQEWKFSLVPARDIFGKYVIYARDFVWNGIRNEEYITLPSLTSNNQFKYPEVKIPIDTFLRFLGYYLAEGFTFISNHIYRVTIATNFKDKYHEKIVRAVEELAKYLGRKIRLDKNGRITFSDKRLALYLSKLGNVYTKHIPRNILELPPDKLRVLLEALVEGDGCKKGEGRMEFYTVNSKLADDVQELALKCGYVAVKINLKPKKGVFIDGRELNGKPSFAVSITTRCKRPRVYIKRNLWDANKRCINTSCVEEWVNYDGMIYCTEVPNHIMLVRRNGKVVWCGNTGILGVIAALHGRNAIQVELERRFYDWMEKARENVEKLPTLSRKGWIVNICGDARKLSELLSQTQPSTIITSPPYLTDNVKRNSEEFWRRVHELGKRWGSKPPAGTEEKQMKSESNIGNLPLGKIDVVLTSPPFTNTATENPNVVELQKKGWVKGGDMAKFLPSNLSKENIGNLPFGNIETVIKGLMTRDGKPTYLSEMFKVYLECFKVLKPNGLMIVVVKPFIRGKKPIDLPYHTYILLSHCGFVLEKLYKLRLRQQSFWRILYHRKHPEVPIIAHEWILVCRKPST
ncbi:MAG: hypothetical protein MRT15_12135 [archaeon YNP-LCB-003-016]|uniref:hypothetical protein n=1 Tax=Candidatus Culexarchaeum yellowstonense TaxID=2928963 RepID=UPI0026F16989|nr:hypothetical protein [Candidatus Culexarchaeum yellowstonense]MCR6693135.1 hypothetical protein [Candidatus Culexarchaeum yellowstonense]